MKNKMILAFAIPLAITAGVWIFTAHQYGTADAAFYGCCGLMLSGPIGTVIALGLGR